MSKKLFFCLMGAGFSGLLLTSCHGDFPVYSEGENLASLTQITNTENTCDYPFGGDNGRNLFFSMRDKRSGSRNIYKKTNPTSASMIWRTDGSNFNLAPTYCQATDKVFFSGQQEGSLQSDIYMVSASDDNALGVITNTPDASENYPSVSSDGLRVVYEKTRTYTRWMDTEIWIKNLQTNENSMLGLGRMPSFSPDGRTIVFVRYASDGSNTSLWTMSTDGSNQNQLTDAMMGFVSRPCFSPDGRRIIFQCRRKQKKDYDLYVIDKNGNNLIQLTRNKSYDGEPYWANDGYIYFTSDRGSRNNHYQIWRFKFGGGGGSLGTIAPTPAPVAQQTQHEVASGETITKIAQQYNVTVRDLVKWNNLSSMTLKPGMKLKVSGN